MLSIDLDEAFYLTLLLLRQARMPGGLLCIFGCFQDQSSFDPARGPHGEPMITFDQAAQLIEVLQETSPGEDGNQGRKKKMETMMSCRGNNGEKSVDVRPLHT